MFLVLPVGGRRRLRAHSRFEAATRRGHRVAHHLLLVIGMLRLKGEPDADDALPADEDRSRPVDRGERDELTGDDVFPSTGPERGRSARADDEDEPSDPWRPERTFPLRGLVIAGAAFAPTFLLIFFGVPYLVSYLSRFMSLHPGDVISTGTPPGVGLGQKQPVYLRGGNRMRLAIEGLGEQNQKVVAD